MRISDWSADVCSSDLRNLDVAHDSAAGFLDDRAGVAFERMAEGIVGGQEEPRFAAFSHNGRTGSTRQRDGVVGVEIGRASCRERVCQYVKITVVDGYLKKKKSEREITTHKHKN